MSGDGIMKTPGWARYALLVLLLIFTALEICAIVYVAISMSRIPDLRPLGWIVEIWLAVALIIIGYAVYDEWRALKLEED